MAAKRRRPAAWLFAGTVLLGVLAAVLIIWPRVARRAFFDRLEVAGARVSYLPGRPDWVRGIAGDSAISIFDDLWELDLSRMEIRRAGLEDVFGHLRNCPHVGLLNFAGAPVVDSDLDVLGDVPQLAELNLSGTDVTDAGLRQVGRCGNLRTLILSNTGVTDAGLVHLRPLRKLEVLILDGTAVSNDGMEFLATLPRLRNVSLSNTDVTDEGVHHLSSELPDLAVSDD